MSFPNKVFWPVTKRDTDYFEQMYKENTKPSFNKSVSHARIFLPNSGFVWFLQRGWDEWQNSNRIGQGCWCWWQGCWCSCDCVSSSINSVEKSGSGNQAWYEKQYIRNETKIISVWVTQFLLSCLFYTWTFIFVKLFILYLNFYFC